MASGELCAPWVTPDECACGSDVATSNPVLWKDMLQVASELLFGLTGSVYPGECQELVRPPHPAGPGAWNAPVWHGEALSSAWVGGGWWAWFPSWASCGAQSIGECSCLGPQRIQLGGFPLVSIDTVKIDGVILGAGEYNIVDQEWLQRLPKAPATAPAYWPARQRLDLADTELDTFSVAYTFGTAPPMVGKRAAESLAADLAEACSPGDCGIPERLASRLYENAQYQFRVVDDPATFKEGLTGNRLADLFIAQENPGKVRTRPVVWSPEVGNRVSRLS